MLHLLVIKFMIQKGKATTLVHTFSVKQIELLHNIMVTSYINRVKSNNTAAQANT
jgi:hypothetical protein